MWSTVHVYYIILNNKFCQIKIYALSQADIDHWNYFQTYVGDETCIIYIKKI